jgi:2'-5' RNA ligase
VRPPAPVLELLAELPRPAEPGVRWVPVEQWHVTLRFFGDTPVTEAADALAAVASSWAGPAPEVELGPRVSRLGRSVVCVPAAGLDGLAASVAEATAGVGGPVDPRPFRGHLTLARLRHRGACGLAGHPVRARFSVGGVELVRSTLGGEGAHHEVVRAFPLAR